MQRFLDTFYLCKYFSWTTFYIYVSQKHFIRNTGGRQFFSVSTSQVYREMNESCICNVWKEKACQLSSRAMCLHCIFFSNFDAWVGEITHWGQTRWFLVICPDGCENTFQNTSAYKLYQLNKQDAYAFKRQYFQSHPKFDTEPLQLCFTQSVRNILHPWLQICQLFFTGMQRVYVPGWPKVPVFGRWWLNNCKLHQWILHS